MADNQKGANPGSGSSSKTEGGTTDHQAPSVAPGTGEAVCPDCAGSGRLKSGEICPTCDGNGWVVPIGAA